MESYLPGLYRRACSLRADAFEPFALEQAIQREGLHSASWVWGVLDAGQPVFLGWSAMGVGENYWADLQALADIEPMGPRMFAQPGHSFASQPTDYPEAFVQGVLIPHGVGPAITGLWMDERTGGFSAMCWHRGWGAPPFTTQERLRHQALMPHLRECQVIHRVQSAMRDLSLVARAGHWAALVAADGLLHFEERGFGDLVRREVPGWQGGHLPWVADAAEGLCVGRELVVSWRPAPGDLKLVHIRPRRASDSLTPREREIGQLLAAGQSVKQTARTLAVAPSTVDNTRSRLYAKLGVNTRAALAATWGELLKG